MIQMKINYSLLKCEDKVVEYLREGESGRVFEREGSGRVFERERESI